MKLGKAASFSCSFLLSLLVWVLQLACRKHSIAGCRRVHHKLLLVDVHVLQAQPRPCLPCASIAAVALLSPMLSAVLSPMLSPVSSASNGVGCSSAFRAKRATAFDGRRAIPFLIYARSQALCASSLRATHNLLTLSAFSLPLSPADMDETVSP